jgi:hypothetical protein
MPGRTTCKLMSEIDPQLFQCLELLSSNLRQFPQEIVERLLSLAEAPEQLVRIDVDNLPASAGETRFVFKPSDLLLDLVATVTRDHHNLIVK